MNFSYQLTFYTQVFWYFEQMLYIYLFWYNYTWTFFLIRNYFTPINNQLMVLLLKKLSLKKFATLQLSLNKLAIILFNSKTIYSQQSWFVTNPRWKFHHPLSPFQEMGILAGMWNLNNIIFCYRNHQQK